MVREWLARTIFGPGSRSARVCRMRSAVRRRSDHRTASSPGSGSCVLSLKIQRNRATALVNHGAGGCELRRVR